MLAMRALKRLDPPKGSDDYETARNCRLVRDRYREDDRLVYLAYQQAVLHEDHLTWTRTPHRGARSATWTRTPASANLKTTTADVANPSR